VLGRFVQPDCLVQDPVNIQSMNRYSYCLNNPVNHTDPSGYEIIPQNSGVSSGPSNTGSSGGRISAPVLYVDGIRIEAGTGGYDTYLGGGSGGGSIAKWDSYGFTGTSQSHTRFVTADLLLNVMHSNNENEAFNSNGYLPGIDDSPSGYGVTLPEMVIIGDRNGNFGKPSYDLWEFVNQNTPTDFVAIPNSIVLSDGRNIGVTFKYTSSDGKNGNNPIRSRTLAVLKTALLMTPGITSIDISASTNGNHKDPRHKEGLGLDIDMFNNVPVRRMQESQMIIDFQKALEGTGFLYQIFGPTYKFTPGHESHVHFTVNRSLLSEKR
jgi:hypothetical protein